MTTPNVDPQALFRRILALEQRCKDLENENQRQWQKIEQQQEQLTSLQDNAASRSSNSKEHAEQKLAITALFDKMPLGFKMTVPTITENVDGMTASQVAARVGTLVREGKLLKHSETAKHPKYSRP